MAFFGSGLYISGVSYRHLLNVSTEHICFVKLSPTVQATAELSRCARGVPEQDTEPRFQGLDKCCPFTVALQLYSCIISSNRYGFTSDSCIASDSMSMTVGIDG